MDCDCFSFVQDILYERHGTLGSRASLVPCQRRLSIRASTSDDFSDALKELDALAAATHGEIELSFNPISHHVAAGRAVIFVGKYPNKQ